MDHGVNLNISTYISPFVQEQDGQLTIRELDSLPNSSMFQLVSAIFGFSPGQSLSPFSGQNEFLSALIAYQYPRTLPRHPSHYRNCGLY
uniref:Uncharacterized protein n=1 Tax=Desertifilum tharense IPPAS B-1220 TaxID=1781255 RepID=A0ACD5GNA7_9CYAN